MRDGAAELYEAYVSFGLTREAFAKTFTRLAHLDGLRSAELLDESMRWVRAAV